MHRELHIKYKPFYNFAKLLYGKKYTWIKGINIEISMHICIYRVLTEQRLQN